MNTMAHNTALLFVENRLKEQGYLAIDSTLVLGTDEDSGKTLDIITNQMKTCSTLRASVENESILRRKAEIIVERQEKQLLALNSTIATKDVQIQKVQNALHQLNKDTSKELQALKDLRQDMNRTNASFRNAKAQFACDIRKRDSAITLLETELRRQASTHHQSQAFNHISSIKSPGNVINVNLSRRFPTVISSAKISQSAEVVEVAEQELYSIHLAGIEQRDSMVALIVKRIEDTLSSNDLEFEGVTDEADVYSKLDTYTQLLLNLLSSPDFVKTDDLVHKEYDLNDLREKLELSAESNEILRRTLDSLIKRQIEKPVSHIL